MLQPLILSNNHAYIFNQIHNVAIDYIYESLDKLNIEYIKTQGNFIMINVKQPSKDVVLKLMKNGFIVRDGYTFMDNWIRVSIGTLQDMEEFIKVLSEVI